MEYIVIGRGKQAFNQAQVMSDEGLAVTAVLAYEEFLKKDFDSSVFRPVIGIADPHFKSHVHDRLTEARTRLSGFISARALVSSKSDISPSAVLFPFSYVGPFSKVGECVLINTGAILEHDAEVGDYSHLAPRSTVLGSSTVREKSLVGAGATILPNLVFPEESVLGAGSVFTSSSFQVQGKYLGAPARLKES